MLIVSGIFLMPGCKNCAGSLCSAIFNRDSQLFTFQPVQMLAIITKVFVYIILINLCIGNFVPVLDGKKIMRDGLSPAGRLSVRRALTKSSVTCENKIPENSIRINCETAGRKWQY